MAHERAENVRAVAQNGNLLPVFGYENDYMGADWNASDIVQFTNNCYSYAMNLPYNPKTGENWSMRKIGVGFAIQLGDFSSVKLNSDWSNIEAVVTNDMKTLGYSFKSIGKNEPPSKSAYKVALVLRFAPDDKDYHWYVQNSNGYWSHKYGTKTVTNTDSSGNLIINPQYCNLNRYKFYGYFEVKKI